MKKNPVIAAIVTALVLLPGCARKEEGLLGGRRIVFGASTSWQNGLGTRTEYSGKNQNGNDIFAETSVYERIDWVEGKDQIRIYSPQATNLAGDSHFSDYVLGAPTSSGQTSSADIQPLDRNGLQWRTGDHYFYAFYPAEGTVWKYDGRSNPKTGGDTGASLVAHGTNQAKVTGNIPSLQEVVWNPLDNEYEPNMNYAYMYAGAYASSAGGNVRLSFHPLVTTLEFNLKAGTLETAGYALTDFKLKSSSSTNTLAGSFEAVLAQPASSSEQPTCTLSATGTSNEISFSFIYPDGTTPPSLEVGSTIKVTVFMLPVRQENLSVELTLTKEGSVIKRTLDLKARATSSDPLESISIDPCCKAYINNLGVASDVYYLEVTSPEKALGPMSGSTSSFTVKSYRRHLGTTDVGDVGWDIIGYSTDGGENWSSDKPQWLTLASSDNAGSIAGKAYSVSSSSKNDAPVVAKVWEGPTTPLGSEDEPIDLSFRDIHGGLMPSQNTANCYVVNQPGYYMFPCVYGNAILRGNSNSKCYSNDQAAGTHFLKNFVRHDGNPIGHDWIEDDGIALTGTQLLWQDVDGLVSSPEVIAVRGKKYIRFHVAPETIWQGNAVIGLFSGSDIVWSWHIWVMEDGGNLDVTEVQSKGSSFASSTRMLNVNLGFCDQGNKPLTRSAMVRIQQRSSLKTAEFTVRQRPVVGFGTNPYYQWGRKDPMLPGSEDYASGVTSESERMGVLWQDKTQYGSYKWKVEEGDGTMAYTIKHPNVFVTKAYPFRYDLWDAYAVFNQDRYVGKTVYDPCPVGFMVPNRNAFNVFSQSGAIPVAVPGGTVTPNLVENHLPSGYLFSTSSTGTNEGIYFPTTSLREGSNGKLRSVSENNPWNGYVWTAVTVNRTNASDVGPMYLEYGNRLTLFTGSPSGVAIYNAAPHFYGFSVRPIMGAGLY